MVDSLGDLKQEIRDLMRRIRVLESASPLGWSSVTEGALEIRSEEGLIVIGSVRISGVMNGDGTITWTGPWNLKGVGTVTGDVAWSGDLNLTGDITVLPGGLIKVGGMTITPFTGGGQIDFGNGRTIDVAAGYMAIRDGARFIVFNSSGVAINGGPGSPTVTIATDGLSISGLPTVKSSLANGAAPGTIWLESNNIAYKVVTG